jgi:hypothetical protein
MSDDNDLKISRLNCRIFHKHQIDLPVINLEWARGSGF